MKSLKLSTFLSTLRVVYIASQVQGLSKKLSPAVWSREAFSNTSYFPRAVADGQAATGAVRLLRNGLSDPELGTVQVYINGSWGNICINMFGENEATVICHQMGRHRHTVYGPSRLVG